MKKPHELRAWIISTSGAVLGGAVAGCFAAAMDPTKYSIPHDIFSGKLWKYFFGGAALTIGGMFVQGMKKGGKGDEIK